MGFAVVSGADNSNSADQCTSYRPLPSPEFLWHELPASPVAQQTVTKTRSDATAIIAGDDDRLLVLVGPCTLHNAKETLEYAAFLKAAKEELKDDLLIVMRANFETPQSATGWKGLINDPDIDGRFNMNKGIRLARNLLCQLNDMGMPAGCEILNTTVGPLYLRDMISWSSVSSRTSESQLHREFASGCSNFPIGFTNGMSGNIQIAVDAMNSASSPHHFLGVNSQGVAAICRTQGSPSSHLILHGSRDSSNYSSEHVAKALLAMERSATHRRVVVINCSQANSRHIPTKQIDVCANVAQQISNGNSAVVGVVIESNLVEGRQVLPTEGPLAVEYGKSITDACLGWKQTLPLLRQLAIAVEQRRSRSR